MSISPGHQSRSLQLIGAVWLLVGVGTLLDPPRMPTPSVYPLEAVPAGIHGALWVASGLLAIILSAWPPGGGRWGFVALVAPAAIRAFSYLWGAVILTLQGDGAARAWVSVIQWFAVVAFVIHEAATPEPAQVEVPE